MDFRLAPRIEKLRILGLAYPTARMAEACYWALRGGTGGGGSFRPVLGPSHRRTVPENSQSSPTMATADIVHQITAESATASIVGQGYWLSCQPRSVIQCHAVCATIAERIIVPILSATT